ncbi:MAG: hypothetical protein U1C51_06180, partial [Candidatus Izemoplasmatales bacterium]|nr:hypothetical protein [Candidatus Izemoplasmatales bacterium]
MKNNLISLNKLIPLLLGIVASFFILLPALVLKNSETAFSGIEVAFGHEFVSLGTWASGKIIFSPLVILAFLLPLIAGILPMVTKKGHLLSALLFGIGAILLFMTPSLTTVTVTVGGIVSEIPIDWVLG